MKAGFPYLLVRMTVFCSYFPNNFLPLQENLLPVSFLSDDFGESSSVVIK
jgi:hypothetical protein